MVYKTASFKPDTVTEIEDEFPEEGKFNTIINNSMKEKIKNKKLREKITPHLHFGGVTRKGLIVEDDHLDGKPCKISLQDNRFWCSECKPKFCMHITFALLHPKIGELEDLDGLV